MVSGHLFRDLGKAVWSVKRDSSDISTRNLESKLTEKTE